MEIEAIWQRIETWLAEHAPELLKELALGVVEAELARFEATLGLRLPEDLRHSFMLHGGQPSGGYGVLGVWTLFGLQDSIDRWRMLTELRDTGTFIDPEPDQLRGPVQQVWWSASWIPIASDGAGNLLCADTAPVSGGKAGQIVLFLHDAPWREVVAESFRELLESFASDLEAEHYRVERAHGEAWLINKNEAVD